MNPLDIQVTYDFICPWCWIGHAHLKAALREANRRRTGHQVPSV